MRFIGNKTRLLKYIKDFIDDNKIKGDIFCDLFSGSSSVGDFFKNDFKIISNDFLKFSTDISKAKLHNDDVPKFYNFIKEYKKDPFDYFNKKKYKYEKDFFITNNYSPRGKRKYFSEENAIKIDGVRIELEEIYKNKIFNDREYYFLLASLLDSATKFSNITGTYEAFLKKWDTRAKKEFLLSPIDINRCSIKKNEVFNLDANSLIRKIKGDILYIDPPYTVTEYSSAYHVLETISKYDFPEISGVTGRRVYNDKKSFYTRKKHALLVFEDLIRQAQFDHIIISYSNESLIPLEKLTRMLSKFSIDNKVIQKRIHYRKYKNIRESKKGRELFEVLIYIKKNNSIIKSPLNYSGSKDKLMPQIIKFLPPYIDSFVDVMGGAFNVGVNIVANEVVYNEYNKYIHSIIDWLIKTDKKEIISYIEKKIRDFNLKKGDKENYIKFREYYNLNQNTKDLFVLSMFAFQNQLRFNSNLLFNTPVGNCSYNKNLKNRIIKYTTKTKNIRFLNKNFINLDYTKFSKDSLFYFDPPYFITNATYNDGKRGFNGWDADQEVQLIQYISKLHLNGYKFILSNIIYHKNKVNHILKEWIDTHDFNVFNLDSGKRKEVLITNFKNLKGER